MPKPYWVTYPVMFSRTKDRGSLVKVRHTIQPTKKMWLRQCWKKREKKKKGKKKRQDENRLVRV